MNKEITFSGSSGFQLDRPQQEGGEVRVIAFVRALNRRSGAACAGLVDVRDLCGLMILMDLARAVFARTVMLARLVPGCAVRAWFLTWHVRAWFLRSRR